MSKHIYIYNQTTKALGLVELLFLTKIENIYKKDCTIYGAYVHSRLFWSDHHKLLELPVETNIISELKNAFNDTRNCQNIAKYFSYLPLKKLQDLNEEKDYYKFIMTTEGEVYTTITGLISLAWRYNLEQITYKLDRFKIHGVQSLSELKHSKIKIKNTNFLRGKIAVMFLIQKVYKLPKFLILLILKEYSFSKLSKIQYICDECRVSCFTKKCHYCYRCHFCNFVYDEIIDCDCEKKKCSDCMKMSGCSGELE